MSLFKTLGLSGTSVANRCGMLMKLATLMLLEDNYLDALEEKGFVFGIASPCCATYPKLCLCVDVHGDDFTRFGPDDGVSYDETESANKFKCKNKRKIAQRTRYERLSRSQ